MSPSDNLIKPKMFLIISETRKRLLIGEEFYASENQNSAPLLADQISEIDKSESNKNPVTNLSSDTFVNGKKSLTFKPNSTQAITEVVNVQKTTCDLSKTLARYQAEFGPIPTIISGRNFNPFNCLFE